MWRWRKRTADRETAVAPVVMGSPTPGVKVVTTALPLKPAARARLSEQLGPGFIVVDMKHSSDSADVVIAPVVSPQLIGILKHKFPRARLVLCELQDFELGISHTGPIQRAIDAGADSYCIAPSLAALAEFVANDDRPALESGRAEDRPAAISFEATTIDDLVLKELRSITSLPG
jgi:hypothetical protein